LNKVRVELLELRRTNAKQKMNINLLRLIATTRICLEASADILSSEGEKFTRDIQSDNKLKQHFDKLKANLALFINDFHNTDMHLFFHRQVIHKYGKQELVDIIKEHPRMEFERQDVAQEVGL